MIIELRLRAGMPRSESRDRVVVTMSPEGEVRVYGRVVAGSSTTEDGDE